MKRAPVAVQSAEDDLLTWAGNMLIGVYVLEHGRFLWTNRRFQQLTDRDAADLIGRRALELVHPADQQLVHREASRQLVAGRVDPYSFRYVTRLGELRWATETVTAIQFRGRPAVLGSFLDVTAQKTAEQHWAHQAFHDPLTGLPNRALFAERFVRALARKQTRSVAVLLLDLDRFKLVNDTLGHTAGDMLLIDVAHRLQSGVRKGDTLVRLGGDEFLVLVEDVRWLSDAVRTAERLLAGLEAPFTIGESELVVGASIGIALGSTATAGPDELLREADVALYQAKDAGRGRYAVYDPDKVLGAETFTLERDLRQAIAHDMLELHYQPCVDLRTGTVAGVEALLRWRHPTLGWVSPATFIPLAEETGLILQIGAWVLEQACETAASWRHLRSPFQHMQIAVNISAREFDDPGLVRRITACLDRTGLPASDLCIEVTESAIMHDVDETQRTLERLKALGVRLAIDDFGTGYASLSYLARFPVDTIKVDQSFVAALGTTPAAAAIVRTVTELAHALNMDVTAEGVETPEQLQLLRSLRCARGQGFYFARAGPAGDVPALLDAHHYLPQLRSANAGRRRRKPPVLAA